MKQENATASKEEKNEKKEKKERTLADLSVTNWLTPENASFFVKNGFLYVKLGEKEERAFLYRQFPFEVEWEFISVMDGECSHRSSLLTSYLCLNSSLRFLGYSSSLLFLRKNNLISLVKKVVNAYSKQKLDFKKLRNLGIGLSRLPLVNRLSGYSDSACELVLSKSLELSELYEFFLEGHFFISFKMIIIYL